MTIAKDVCGMKTFSAEVGAWYDGPRISLNIRAHPGTPEQSAPKRRRGRPFRCVPSHASMNGRDSKDE